MRHKNYFKFVADNNFDLGFQLGEAFKSQLVNSLERASANPDWTQKIEKSKLYLEYTEKNFPKYIDEIKGYAKGAGVEFIETWARSLEDELSNYKSDKCTTVVTNQGMLISHNEDWDKDAQDSICILEKSVNGLTIFELFYYNTLGGNSISINSHGFVQAINTLTHSDWQIGIPRNVIARFLSETSNPEADFEKLKQLPRSMGYNHALIRKDGTVWDIECSSKLQELNKPELPFVHTNHYLFGLKSLDSIEKNNSSFNRYEKAKQFVQNEMTDLSLIELASNQCDGPEISILNERTIGRLVIDLESKIAKVWLLREQNLGWVEYQLDFLETNSN